MPVRTLFALLLVTGPLLAAPFESEPTAPYTWRVLLNVAPHRTLGPAVRTRIAADLKAALGPALGDDLGTVQVIDLADTPKDKWEPLWKAWEKSGWAALDDAEFRTFTNVKTHFLTVSENSGKYTLEARQHCGYTCLASPRVRTKTVPDLDTLSRTAGLMLAADFGPVATVEPLPDTVEHCLVRMRGGELPGADRWLKIGDVFQFVVVQDVPRPKQADAKPAPTPRPGQVMEVPADRKGQPQTYSLIRVQEVLKPGVAKAEVFTRFATPFVKSRTVVGYRGLKLATCDAAVSVRLADTEGQSPPPGTPLQVWATEYPPRVKPGDRDVLDLEKGKTDLFATRKTLRGVATVVVKLGSSQSDTFPVPILDSGEAVKLTVGFNVEAVRKAKFEDKAERYLNRVIDARRAQEEMFKAVGRLIEKDDPKAALARATAGLKGYTALDATLTKELADLKQTAEAKGPLAAGLLLASERVLDGLRKEGPGLEGRIKDLEAAIAKADNPAEYEKELRGKEINRRIGIHVRRGDIPEALAEYDALIDLTKRDDVKAAKAKLEAEWTPKDDAHADARKYLTDTWAKANSLEEFDAATPVLEQKINLLATANDRLGLRLAVTMVEEAAVRLNDLAAGLDVDFQSDKEKLLAIKKTTAALTRVDEALRAELKRVEELKAEKKPPEGERRDVSPPVP